MQRKFKYLKPIPIPNPIDLPEWVANKKNLNQTGHISILYLGKIKKEKGIFDLIEAIPSVIAQYSNVRFIICGSGQINKARQLCEAPKIQKYVEFPGWVDERTKLNFLHQANILVLPSYYEELPYAILEGMAAGLAIAASRVGGIPSLIENGVNGVLFEPGNISEIARSLNFLIANHEIRMAMGKNNIDKIKDQFSPAKISASFLEVYQTLIMDDHNEKRIENSRGNYHS
ncbi:MAG: glycosyltransferase family 4 protein [candidate division KSB1 bacterium]|nr:glycosyltransferase family 4 protein [candidate division KSB1 bacterium]